jgi:hypothetical protein
MAKKERLNARAERVMGRAQKNYNKAQAAIAADKANPDKTSNTTAYVDKKFSKAYNQGERAKALKAKADSMKKGGAVKKKK